MIVSRTAHAQCAWARSGSLACSGSLPSSGGVAPAGPRSRGVSLQLDRSRGVSPLLARSRGVSLVESLVAILLFAIGALALIAMFASSVGTAGEAAWRSEAAALADRALQTVASGVARNSASAPYVTGVAGSLDSWALRANQERTDQAPCGADATIPEGSPWAAWVADVMRRMPGGMAPVITAEPDANNRVTVRICWMAGGGERPRAYEAAGYVF